jgi:putative NIF3 family GTP cyclohydrolase 1 type 2
MNAKDSWIRFDLGEYIYPDYIKYGNGLLLDNTKEIESVFTAVFPEKKVLDKVLTLGRKSLLFLHHPMIWDPSCKGYPFRNIPDKYIRELSQAQISLYNLHTPLDKNGKYSTGMTLVKKLGLKPVDEFFNYNGVKVGVIGRTIYSKVEDLSKSFKKAVTHRIKVWGYGAEEIKNSLVGVVGGGGNDQAAAHDLHEKGINIYITGVTLKNPDYEPSIIFHKVMKEYDINVLAGTHYSTEKFACKAMVNYFRALGLHSQFLNGTPEMLDLG